MSSETRVVFTKWPDRKHPLAPAATYKISTHHSGDDVDAPSGDVPVQSGEAPAPSDDGSTMPDDKSHAEQVQSEKEGVVKAETTPTTPEAIKPQDSVAKDEATPTKQQRDSEKSSPEGVAKDKATPTPGDRRSAWGEPVSGGPAPSPAAPQQSVGETLTVQDIELGDPQHQGAGPENLKPHDLPPQIPQVRNKKVFFKIFHQLLLFPKAHSMPEREEEGEGEVEAAPPSPTSFQTACSTTRPVEVETAPLSPTSFQTACSTTRPVEVEAAPPSPTSFQTACSTTSPVDGSSRLSQSLRDGEFDTCKHLLRTCSLPNLNSSQLVSQSSLPRFGEKIIVFIACCNVLLCMESSLCVYSVRCGCIL